MELTCPKCNKPLPEVAAMEFRYCPHCGAEIPVEPQPLEDAYLTTPPDSAPPRADYRPMDLSPATETVAGQFNDETSEPQPRASRQQPKLKPPDLPPPAGFFRAHSDEKTPSIRSGEKVPVKKVPAKKVPAKKVPAKKDKKQPSPAKNRNIVIATLIILAMIILLLGALFTF